MQFDSFRALKGWTLAQAAAAMRVPGDESLEKINEPVISRHERGLTFPSPEHIARYEVITEGAVTYQDWLALRASVKSAVDAKPKRQPAAP